MRNWHGFTLLFAVSLVTTACGSTIFKPIDIDSGKGYSIDARQRAILVTHQGGPGKDKLVVCAEPSPDAIVALGTALAAEAKLNKLNVEGSFAHAATETAAAIGKRTSTIQLLRDGLYRACEAYMNGAIDKTQYTLILTHYDKAMITLLAIEALTGQEQAAQVALAAQAAARPAQSQNGTQGAQQAAPSPTSTMQFNQAAANQWSAEEAEKISASVEGGVARLVEKGWNGVSS